MPGQVTVKLTYTEPSPSRPTAQSSIPRPASPIKFQPAPIRPRAKINSSATPASARKPGTRPPSRNAATTPRPVSPAKPPPRGALSPTYQPKTRLAIRSNLTPTPAVIRSTPSTPLLRHRSQTSGSDTVPSTPQHTDRFASEVRARRGSVSLQGSTVSSGSSQSHSDRPPGRHRSRSPSSVRIKAKVSGGVAKHVAESLSPPASQPILPASTRRPSLSSNVSSSTSPPSSSSKPPPVFYPITTATPAANPHRFATARTSPTHPAHHHYQPFQQPQDDSFVNYARKNGFGAKVIDPASIPLPPTSPPTSIVSFSSRSSVSYAPESVPSTQNGGGDSDKLRDTLDNLMRYTDMASREDTHSHSGDSGQDRDTDGEANTAERKVRAEAKSNRKIADLEITNRSLLAINVSLESTKHRQAKEIRELRRKLRESRLILPPRTFRAVKSSLDHDDTAEEDPEDADDEEDEEKQNNDDDAGDEVYKRIKIILEGLLENGKRALERTVSDGGAKVLSADEVRTWRDSSDHATVVDGDGDGDGEGVSLLLSPALVAVQDGLDSEDEVEAMTLTSESMRSSPAPPILVTNPH